VYGVVSYRVVKCNFGLDWFVKYLNISGFTEDVISDDDCISNEFNGIVITGFVIDGFVL